jgi:uncharacterized protein
MPLLIDGYNLLHHSGLLPRRLGPGGLERARTAMLGTLAGLLAPDELEHTTVVFDAKEAPPDGERAERIQGIRVLYATGYDEADDLLEELIRREPTPKRLLVVSSDVRIQRAARRRRAEWESSEDWIESLRRRQRIQGTRPADPEKPEAVVDDEDVDYWLRSFGFDRPDTDR